MQFERWIILSVSGPTENQLTVMEQFDVESDPQPGLNAALGQVDPTDKRRFYALRITQDRTVSLQTVDVAPRLGTMIWQTPEA